MKLPTYLTISRNVNETLVEQIRPYCDELKRVINNQTEHFPVYLYKFKPDIQLYIAPGNSQKVLQNYNSSSAAIFCIKNTPKIKPFGHFFYNVMHTVSWYNDSVLVEVNMPTDANIVLNLFSNNQSKTIYETEDLTLINQCTISSMFFNIDCFNTEIIKKDFKKWKRQSPSLNVQLVDMLHGNPPVFYVI